jgi:hypothetical protein
MSNKVTIRCRRSKTNRKAVIFRYPS